MKVFHIDQFKCTLCSNWFCPPFNLPYRLKCTHSICTNCLQKSVSNKSSQIICPEDLQRNKISQINVNQSTKKALQRLLKQHKNFTQTNHLQCIKSLSLNFDELLDSKEIQLKNLSTLVDQIFHNQIKRLRQIYQKIKTQINRPFRVVNDWKQVVKAYLKKVKSTGPNTKGCINEFNHYIDEGRKIKLDLNEYLKYDFKELIDHLILYPQICFTHNFSIFNQIQKEIKLQKSEIKNKNQKQKSKQNWNERQILLEDVSNNLDQSSIRVNKIPRRHIQQNSNKVSLFEELIQQTPKNTKISCYNFANQIDNSSYNNKSPLNQLILSNSSNKNFGKKTQTNIFSNNKYYQTNEQIDYNKTIKQKIKKLKDSKADQNKQNNQNVKKLGRSLQYSPDGNQYNNYQIYDNLNQQDYSNSNLKNKNKQKIKSKNVHYQIKQEKNRNQTKSFKNDQNNNQMRSQNYNLNWPQNEESLHSYYQQETTIKASNRSDQFSQSPVRFNENICTSKERKYQASQLYDQQMLLDQKSNRKQLEFDQSYNICKQPTKKYGSKQGQEKQCYENLNQGKIDNQQTRKNDWKLEHLNFLKEWKVNKNSKEQQELQIIQKYGGYDCEKQKNKYIKKIQQNKVRQILKQTVIGQNYIELVGHCLNDVNMSLFLDQINWNYRNIQIVKFIKTSLSDNQLNQLLNYLVRSNVHTLMLSYNNLSQISLDGLLNFVQINKKLKNIYLPKNNISLLKGNARIKINLLKQKGINLYI